MTEYVLGFLFDEFKENVVLIEKQKPDWQKGRLNGIGGKIEEGETPEEAMIREFREETGATVLYWRKYAVLEGKDFRMYCFHSTDQKAFDEAKTMETETVHKKQVKLLSMSRTIENLPWLIPLSLDVTRKEVNVVYQ
jgi:8-oxo-dGTP diphosphatase